MLTRKQKRSLLFFSIGFASGVVLSCGVAYFGFIAGYTKDTVSQISQLLPHALDDSTENLNDETPQHQSKVIDTVVYQEKPAVKKEDDVVLEEKVNESVLLVWSVDSTMQNNRETRKLLVEQWENPLHFVGYKLSNEKLILYGIAIEQIELEEQNDTLFLIFSDKRFPLQIADHFSRLAF